MVHPDDSTEDLVRGAIQLVAFGMGIGTFLGDYVFSQPGADHLPIFFYALMFGAAWGIDPRVFSNLASADSLMGIALEERRTIELVREPPLPPPLPPGFTRGVCRSRLWRKGFGGRHFTLDTIPQRRFATPAPEAEPPVRLCTDEDGRWFWPAAALHARDLGADYRQPVVLVDEDGVTINGGVIVGRADGDGMFLTFRPDEKQELTGCVFRRNEDRNPWIGGPTVEDQVRQVMGRHRKDSDGRARLERAANLMKARIKAKKEGG